MKKSHATPPQPMVMPTAVPEGQQDAVALATARIDALRALMPYEAPEVVSLPLGGSPRIFPVYMGNM